MTHEEPDGIRGRRMTTTPSPARLLALLAVLAALPVPAASQSLLGFRALGVPVGAVGSRTATVGNLGIGLAGVEVSASDPSTSARLAFPTVSVSMQPAWGEFELGEQVGATNTTRFPLLGVAYPVVAVQGVVTLALAGYMEQRWVGEVPRTIALQGEEVDASDRFESNGGTSVARIGWAQRIGNRLAVGASVGVYMGRLDRTFDRTLDSLAVDGGAESFGRTGSWTYGGPTVSVGFNADPHRLIHLSGAVEWSGELKATPQEDTEGGVLAYAVPMRFLAGATGRLTPRLHLNASLAYQDWSQAAGFERGSTASRTISWGAGIEWQAVQRGRRSFPLRFGYRRLALPFRFGSDDAVEGVWSAGMGVNLDQADGARFGWIDVGGERAGRSSAPLVERFWRATVTVGISRF